MFAKGLIFIIANGQLLNQTFGPTGEWKNRCPVPCTYGGILRESNFHIRYSSVCRVSYRIFPHFVFFFSLFVLLFLRHIDLLVFLPRLYLYFLQGTCLYLYSALLPNGIRLWMKEKLSRWQCLHKHGLKVTVIKMFAMKLCLLFLKPSEWVMKIIQSIRVVKTSILYF